MKEKIIKIGTRDSELALWQAHDVEKRLNNLGHKTEIIAVKSTGDVILDKPLYELGITGIFTKTLDAAMISGQIDIAVHSMKDVPTALPQGMVQGAVLERASVFDVLIYKENLDFLETSATIATGSLRRQAMWLHKYPNHKTVDLRGNVNSRLKKLQENHWNGAIFATAGLDRINIKPANYINLDWMLPAPAQGAMMVVAMNNDIFSLEALSQINHVETEITTYIERQFLRTLEGGCTAPIGALAKYNEADETFHFHGALFSLDGSQKIEIEQTFALSDWKKLGYHSAHHILNNGGTELMEKIKFSLQK
jgi:hydroxymethylbilane synthase